MMPLSTRPLRALLVFSLLILSVVLGALAAVKMPPAHDAKSRPATAAGLRPLPPPSASWKQVDALVEQQKAQAALDLATKLRTAAQKRKDDAEWARGLIREVQLRMALHGYETAVRFLREQPWPQSRLPHDLLQLAY